MLCIHKKVAEADIFATKDLQSTLHTNPMKSETVLSHDQCHVTHSQNSGGGGYGRFGLDGTTQTGNLKRRSNGFQMALEANRQ